MYVVIAQGRKVKGFMDMHVYGKNFTGNPYRSRSGAVAFSKRLLKQVREEGATSADCLVFVKKII